MLRISVALAVLLLAGCSLLQPVVNKSAEEVARLVDQYCAEVDENVRTELREAVNSELDGNSIVITCK